MVKRMLGYSGVAALLFIFACNQSNVTEPDDHSKSKKLKMIVDKIEYQKLEALRKSGKGVSDPFTIEKVEVVKDSLAITVSYLSAASKSEHTFTLCWAGEIAIMIYPMPAILILTHNANGNTGNTKYNETLMFSLKDLGIKDSRDYIFIVWNLLNSSDKPDGTTTTKTNDN